MKKLALIAIISLAGCSSIESIYTDVPKGVATAQASLAAAEHTALIYTALPVCGKTSATLCRDPVITAKIGVADNVAFNAVEAAYKAETQDTLNAALTAVNALNSLTDALPVAALPVI